MPIRQTLKDYFKKAVGGGERMVAEEMRDVGIRIKIYSDSNTRKMFQLAVGQELATVYDPREYGDVIDSTIDANAIPDLEAMDRPKAMTVVIEWSHIKSLCRWETARWTGEEGGEVLSSEENRDIINAFLNWAKETIQIGGLPPLTLQYYQKAHDLIKTSMNVYIFSNTEQVRKNLIGFNEIVLRTCASEIYGASWSKEHNKPTVLVVPSGASGQRGYEGQPSISPFWKGDLRLQTQGQGQGGQSQAGQPTDLSEAVQQGQGGESDNAGGEQ